MAMHHQQDIQTSAQTRGKSMKDRTMRRRFETEALRARFAALRDDETGDVPGWVLVTLMTAGLVVAIWALAGPALSALFEQAISRVSGL